MTRRRGMLAAGLAVLALSTAARATDPARPVGATDPARLVGATDPARLTGATDPARREGETDPACPAVAVPPLPAPRLAEAIRRERAVRIVAFGSSSTAGAGASAPWMAYPARLEARLRAALPRHGVTVLNRGVGGEDADAMLVRLERDVIAADPDLVVWQVGANAALRSMDKADFDRFLREGLARLRAAGIDVVLMDNQRAPRIAARPGHRDYDAMLSAAAASVPGVALFSRGALMDGWAAAGLPHGAALIEDGLHHNDVGYRCVAEALAGALLAGAAAGQGAAAR